MLQRCKKSLFGCGLSTLGYCSGSDRPGNAFGSGRGYGRGGGYGRGFGFGRGMGAYGRNWFGRSNVDVSEKTLLENEKRLLQDQLDGLKKRLSALGDQDS